MPEKQYTPAGLCRPEVGWVADGLRTTDNYYKRRELPAQNGCRRYVSCLITTQGSWTRIYMPAGDAKNTCFHYLGYRSPGYTRAISHAGSIGRCHPEGNTYRVAILHALDDTLSIYAIGPYFTPYIFRLRHLSTIYCPGCAIFQSCQGATLK